MTTEIIRKIIRESMRLREESYVSGDGETEYGFYKMTMEQAATQACADAGVDHLMAPLIWLALSDGTMNDVQAWADGEYDSSFTDAGKLIDGPTMAEKHSDDKWSEFGSEIMERDELVDKLARRFAEHIRTAMSDGGAPGDLEEMLRRNREEKDPKVCHTHDYMDANMEMAQAFLEVVSVPVNVESETHTRTVNDAWDLAKRNEFWVTK